MISFYKYRGKKYLFHSCMCTVYAFSLKENAYIELYMFLWLTIKLKYYRPLVCVVVSLDCFSRQHTLIKLNPPTG